MVDRLNEVEKVKIELQQEVREINNKVYALNDLYARLDVKVDNIQKFIEKLEDKKFKIFMQIFKWGGAIATLTITWIFGHNFGK